MAGQAPRFWTWETGRGISWLTTKIGLLVLVCYSCSVTRPLNDIGVETTHLHCLMLVMLIEPCRTRSSHFCRAYNFHRHICYSKTHSVPSTTCRSSIHHHRLHRHMYHIGTAVLSLASMQSSHNSCYPYLTPTSVSKMIQGGSIIPRRVFSDTIRPSHRFWPKMGLRGRERT
jgi:hypothetical protein